MRQEILVRKKMQKEKCLNCKAPILFFLENLSYLLIKSSQSVKTKKEILSTNKILQKNLLFYLKIYFYSM